jgi:hypothetical protein
VGGNPVSRIDPDGLNSIENGAPLRLMHSPQSLSQASLNFHRSMPTAQIIASLAPGAAQPLPVDPKTGTVWDGNTRITVLNERGVDTNKLPRTSYSPSVLRGLGVLGFLLMYKDFYNLMNPPCPEMY